MNHANSERDRFVLVLFYGVLLLVGYLTFRVVGPFLAPLGWAAVFAMVLNPIHANLARRTGEPQGGHGHDPAGVLHHRRSRHHGADAAGGRDHAARSAHAGRAASRCRRRPKSQVWYEALRQRAPIPLPADLTSTLVDAVRAIATFLAGRAGSILQNVASFVFQLFVMMFGLFYFLRDGDRIVEHDPEAAAVRARQAGPHDRADARTGRRHRRIDLRRGDHPGSADRDSPWASSGSSPRCSGA